MNSERIENNPWMKTAKTQLNKIIKTIQDMKIKVYKETKSPENRPKLNKTWKEISVSQT